MSATVTHVAPVGSIGIRRYAERLAAAIEESGVHTPLAERDPRDGHAHLHLGNSTRSLYPDIARAARPSVITLHDVIPRTPLLRPVLVPYQRHLLAAHVTIVHSRFAQSMLRERGLLGTVHVIPHGADLTPPDADAVAELRRQISPDGRPILALAGVLNEVKRAPELIGEAAKRPGFAFLLAGRIGDAATRRALVDAPENVHFIGGEDGIADHELFLRCIACADLLLNLRTGSVGEASGPVAEAHALGTPVAGLDVGALAEYCGPQDRIFPAGTSLAEMLSALAAEERFERVPADSPVNVTWADTARQTIEVYREIGWL